MGDGTVNKADTSKRNGQFRCAAPVRNEVSAGCAAAQFGATQHSFFSLSPLALWERQCQPTFPGRSAARSEAEWCAADPGSMLVAPGPRVCTAALRAAVRPGKDPPHPASLRFGGRPYADLLNLLACDFA